MTKKLVYFENDYWHDYNYCHDYRDTPLESDDDRLFDITIDGYPEDENAEGEVVVVLILTKHNDIVIEWHDNAYRMNENVLELVEESKTILKEQIVA